MDARRVRERLETGVSEAREYRHMNVWWVNNKQTARHEIGGGYLWSPKRERNGARSQYYDFMRQTRPGDVIVSFADARIGHYGIVSGFPVTAPKPPKFGRAGENWSNDGWLVPVTWEVVNQPFRPKDHIDQLRSYLPERYSPIQANGNGNQKAYLTKIDQPLLEELMRLGAFDHNAIEADQDLAHGDALIEQIEEEIQDRIRGDSALMATEAAALVKARRGQGIFRKNVERIEPCCRVTGLEDKRLLIASHVKPWRVCETARERLDGSNGLLLAPHIDRLFDKGLISFEQVGTMQVSSTLDDRARHCLGQEQALQDGVGEFTSEQEQYLGYHRDSVYVQ